MRVASLLMTIIGLGLSLVYSGLLAVILENGTELTWFLEFGQLEPAQLCVFVAGILAVLGILFVLAKKKFGAVLLIIGAVAIAVAEYQMGVTYPYSRATAVLFALAGICGWSGASKKDYVATTTEEPETVTEEAPATPEPAAPAAEATPVAAPVEKPAAEPVVAPAAKEEVVAEKATATATPEPEPVQAPAAPVQQTGSAKNVLAFIIGLASAGWALYCTGVGADMIADGTNFTWLVSFGELETPTLWILVPAVLAVLGALFAAAKKRFGAVLLCFAAGMWAYAGTQGIITVPYFLAAPVAAFIGALFAWCAAESRSRRRYTACYVLGCLFAIAGAAIAYSQSGLCPICHVKPIEGLALQLAGISVGLGAIGALLSLLGITIASLFLVAAMFITLGGELVLGGLYPCAWIAVALFALASMLSASNINADDPSTAPRKCLTAGGAFVVALLAAVAGGALSWYGSQLIAAASRNDELTNDPAYQKVVAEVAARDTKIAELDEKLKEQMDLVTERDSKIEQLTAENGGKVEEIAAMEAKNAERDAQFAELQGQLEQANAKLAEAKAASAKKYIFLRGANNVRNVSNSDKGSKVISRLTDEVVEMLEVAYPKGAKGSKWYKVKGSFGTGWVWGKNAVELKLN